MGVPEARSSGADGTVPTGSWSHAAVATFGPGGGQATQRIAWNFDSLAAKYDAGGQGKMESDSEERAAEKDVHSSLGGAGAVCWRTAQGMRTASQGSAGKTTPFARKTDMERERERESAGDQWEVVGRPIGEFENLATGKVLKKHKRRELRFSNLGKSALKMPRGLRLLAGGASSCSPVVSCKIRLFLWPNRA